MPELKQSKLMHLKTFFRIQSVDIFYLICSNSNIKNTNDTAIISH